jgi:hypothetical protein
MAQDQVTIDLFGSQQRVDNWGDIRERAVSLLSPVFLHQLSWESNGYSVRIKRVLFRAELGN